MKTSTRPQADKAYSGARRPRALLPGSEQYDPKAEGLRIAKGRGLGNVQDVTAVDHGSLAGLGDDDHNHYLMSSRFKLDTLHKTTSYTVTSSDSVVTGDANAGAITFTLPSASANPKKVFFFKKLDSSANAVTVSRAGSDLIDGATSYSLNTQYKGVWIVSDGTSSWHILSKVS